MRDSRADGGGLHTGRDVELAAVDAGHITAAAQVRRHTLFGKEALQLALHRLGNPVAVARAEAIEDQLLDPQVNAPRRHAQPRISASSSGFSSLAYSTLAACKRWHMRTGSLASAARKAA